MTELFGEGGGRFVLGPPLATGGHGIVYAAVDTRDGRDVVVKVALIPGDPTLRSAALRQAALADHPQVGRHLVPVWDVGTWEDRPFAAFERLPYTLDAYLARGGSPIRAARALLEAAAALARAGAIHGDLKPSNVFVVDDEDEAAVLFSDLWCGVGPPPLSAGFSAPEAWTGEVPTLFSDRYALGATLVATFSGQPPPCAAPPARRAVPTDLAALPVALTGPVRRLLDLRPHWRPSPATVLTAWDRGQTRRRGAAVLAIAVVAAIGVTIGSVPPSPPSCPAPFALRDGVCRAADGRAVVWVPPGSFRAGAPPRSRNGRWTRTPSQQKFRAACGFARPK